MHVFKHLRRQQAKLDKDPAKQVGEWFSQSVLNQIGRARSVAGAKPLSKWTCHLGSAWHSAG